MGRSTQLKRRNAFSLVELVIVVVIIGIVAAIAVPKMSRGAAGAADAALTADLQMIRNAVEMYRAEHGNYPDPTNVLSQLTSFTAPDGTVGTYDPGSNCIYGPYLQSMPGLPVGSTAERGNTMIGSQGTVGWLYTVDPSGQSCRVTANTSATDVYGHPYNQY